VSGDLHLQWGHFTHAAPSVAAANAAQPRLNPPDEERGEPEDQLAELVAKLTPQQRATYFAILKPPPAESLDTFELVPNVVSSPPASVAPALAAPLPGGGAPISAVLLPPERQIWRNALMSLCGTLHGHLPSDFFASCRPGDLDFSAVVDCGDLAIVKASFGKRDGQVGFDPRADTNGDGVVDVRDLAFVARKLPAGTSCP
jgi:Dockerin type I domain